MSAGMAPARRLVVQPTWNFANKTSLALVRRRRAARRSQPALQQAFAQVKLGLTGLARVAAKQQPTMIAVLLLRRTTYINAWRAEHKDTSLCRGSGVKRSWRQLQQQGLLAK